MNWVGGARSRVKAQNERKLQKEFFERRRHNGPLKQIKRPFVQRSPPMGVVYKSKPTISQDLISLRKLQNTCDERIMNINEPTKPPSFKVPQKINLSSKPYGSNFNMELPTSPISQPSTLELQDANSAEGGVSLYEDQPRVSTGKINTTASYKSFLVPPPGKRRQFDESTSFDDTSCEMSLLGESVLPLSYKGTTKDGLSRPLSFPSQPPPRTSNYTLMSGHSEIPIKQRGVKQSLLPPKRLVDTERPLLITSSDSRGEKKKKFDWDNMDWYGKREKVSLSKKENKKQDPTFKNTIPIKRKNNYDRETPFTTGQTLSLLDFHKIEQGRYKPKSPRPFLPNIDNSYNLESFDKLPGHETTIVDDVSTTKSVLVKRDSTSSVSTSVCHLLEEDPVGGSYKNNINPKSYVTPGSSPGGLYCSESLSQMSDTIKRSNDRSLKSQGFCAFETMMKSFEKPTLINTSKKENQSNDHSTNVSRVHVEDKIHSSKWMNFVHGSDDKKEVSLTPQSGSTLETEDVMNGLPLVVSTVVKNNNNNSNEELLHNNILLSQEEILSHNDDIKNTNVELIILSDESPEPQLNEVTNALSPKYYNSVQHIAQAKTNNSTLHSSDSSILHSQSAQIQTNNSIIHSAETPTSKAILCCAQTQTKNCIINSAETQTDNFIFCCAQTQTNNSIFHSTSTQTENSIVSSTDTQTDNSKLHSAQAQTSNLILHSVQSQTELSTLDTLSSSTSTQAGTVKDSPHYHILQELSCFYDKIASLSSEENNEELLSTVDSLVKEINKHRNTLIWCALMSKLKSL